MFGGVLGWLGGSRRGGGSGTGEAAAKPASANAGEAPAQPQQYHTGAVEQPDAPEGGVLEPTGSPFRKLTSAEEVRRSPRQAAAAAAHQPRRGKGVRVKKELPLGQLRSYAESIALKGAPLLPLGFPTWPWETREAVKAEIAAFCRNPSTGGGSHGVVWKQLSSGNDIHGPQCALACHKHVDGCSWRIKFEQTLEGWTPYSTFGDHSAHTLAQSVEEANVHKAMRDIPSELVQHAKNMADSGIPVCAIDRFLRHQVMLVGDAPTWTYQDVYHLVGASTRQRAMDATGFCEQLFEREHRTGLFQRRKTDADGCLSHVFFVMEGAHELISIDPDNVVVELDTKARAPLLRPEAAPRAPPPSEPSACPLPR
jgi:hypothetical protein